MHLLKGEGRVTSLGLAKSYLGLPIFTVTTFVTLGLKFPNHLVSLPPICFQAKPFCRLTGPKVLFSHTVLLKVTELCHANLPCPVVVLLAFKGLQDYWPTHLKYAAFISFAFIHLIPISTL